MHLCTCVSEEGGDGDGTGSEIGSGINVDSTSMDRPAISPTGPRDSPGWEKFLPRRVMSGTGLRFSSNHFIGLEGQGGNI